MENKTDLQKYKEKVMKDPEFKKAYDELKMDNILRLGLTKPFIQKGRSFINIKDDDSLDDVSRFLWSDEHFGMDKNNIKMTNQFQLYLETGTGFRFLVENENADTFLLPEGETDGGVYLNWDDIENDIKMMGLHLLPMAELEVLEGVSFILPERKFIWGANGAVFVINPVWTTDKREVLSDGGKE